MKSPDRFTLLVANIAVKVALTIAAYHFSTVGNMFLAGMCLGWILLEALGLVILAGAIVYAILFED